MRRILLAFLITVIGLSSASAQTKEEKPVSHGTVRIAVVNIGVVFDKYERARLFKKELEELLVPFKNQGQALTEQMETWEKKARTADIDSAKKVQLEANILSNKRQLCDLQGDISRLIRKKHDENLVVLWKEVQNGIKTYAIQEGIHLVFSYSEGSQYLFCRDRKQQAIDIGSMTPLFMAPEVDITDAIIKRINKQSR